MPPIGDQYFYFFFPNSTGLVADHQGAFLPVFHLVISVRGGTRQKHRVSIGIRKCRERVVLDLLSGFDYYRGYPFLNWRGVFWLRGDIHGYIGGIDTSATILRLVGKFNSSGGGGWQFYAQRCSCAYGFYFPLAYLS